MAPVLGEIFGPRALSPLRAPLAVSVSPTRFARAVRGLRVSGGRRGPKSYSVSRAPPRRRIEQPDDAGRCWPSGSWSTGPHDVSVVSFDDMEWAPPPPAADSSRAADLRDGGDGGPMLLDRSRRRQQGRLSKLFMDPELIVLGSTGSPAGKGSRDDGRRDQYSPVSGFGETPAWWRGGVELARLHQNGWVGFTTRKGEAVAKIGILTMSDAGLRAEGSGVGVSPAGGGLRRRLPEGRGARWLCAPASRVEHNRLRRTRPACRRRAARPDDLQHPRVGLPDFSSWRRTRRLSPLALLNLDPGQPVWSGCSPRAAPGPDRRHHLRAWGISPTRTCWLASTPQPGPPEP